MKPFDAGRRYHTCPDETAVVANGRWSCKCPGGPYFVDEDAWLAYRKARGSAGVIRPQPDPRLANAIDWLERILTTAQKLDECRGRQARRLTIDAGGSVVAELERVLADLKAVQAEQAVSR